MKKNKRGLTLAEVLIALVTAGLVLAISANAIKTARASYTETAYFAHRNMQNLTGTLYSGFVTHSNRKRVDCNPAVDGAHCICREEDRVINDDGKKGACKKGAALFKYEENSIGTEELKFENETTPLPAATTTCIASNGRMVTVFKNDFEADTDAGKPCSSRTSSGTRTNLFCKSLAAISNKTGKAVCTGTLIAPKTASNKEPEFDVTNSSFKINSPNFTLANGMRYYISGWTKHSSVSNDYGFRLVMVDLNGKKNPNEPALSSNSKPGDLITFLILDNGEVYPLGAAADNIKSGSHTTRYINANVKGLSYSDDQYKPGLDSNGKKVENTNRRNLDTVILDCKLCHGRDDCRRRYVKDAQGNETKDELCNLSVSAIGNSRNKGLSSFTYREAFCSAFANTNIGYTNYCSGYEQNAKCPPSPNPAEAKCKDADGKDTSGAGCVFDQCRVDTVKPAFRYSFN